jgi:hypothetical protein
VCVGGGVVLYVFVWCVHFVVLYTITFFSCMIYAPALNLKKYI